jgi:hypothetical protein
MAKYRMIAARVGSEHLNKDVDIDDHVFFDEQQRLINRLLGISDDVFMQTCKSKEAADPSINGIQRKVNWLMGIDEATFRKYNK